MDTPREIINELQPQKISGLYFLMDGHKYTPHRIWFGIDVRFRGKGFEDETQGRAFFHYNSALHPVYTPDGHRFVRPDLSNVTASYKDGILYDWRRE